MRSCQKFSVPPKMKKNADITALIEETRIISSRYTGAAEDGALECNLGVEGYMSRGYK